MTLNILFMTLKRDDLVCLDYAHYLEQAIGEEANCKWAGRGWPDYKSESLNVTVKRVMPDADWVIYYDFEIRREGLNTRIALPHKRKYKVATITSDIHREQWQHISELNRGKWDAFLMLYTMVGAEIDSKRDRWCRKIAPDRFLVELNAPIFNLTPSINPAIFNMFSKTRDIDALYLGNAIDYIYPLRNSIYTNLKALGIKNKWKTIVRWSPAGAALSRKKREYIEQGHIVGRVYANHLSRAKCFLFGTSVFRYPLLKFFEGMASGACIFSDLPLQWEMFHFEPDVNMVEINIHNWKDKLNYYLENEGERKKIALEGYKMTMKHHTNEVRAKQLVDFLEAH